MRSLQWFHHSSTRALSVGIVVLWGVIVLPQGRPIPDNASADTDAPVLLSSDDAGLTDHITKGLSVTAPPVLVVQWTHSVVALNPLHRSEVPRTILVMRASSPRAPPPLLSEAHPGRSVFGSRL